MEFSAIKELDARNYMTVFNRQNLCFTRGEGCKLYDTTGKEYTDFVAGIAVNVLGHRHPALTAAIKVYDWNQEGDNRTLDCGFFILDNYTFSWWPMEGTISAVSVPADSAFRATQRTKTWEKATLQAIGTEIAARAGITLVWDVEGEPITVESVEQSEQTDCEFYMNLCNTYGLAMKV